MYFDVVVIALNKAVKDELISANPAHKINYKDRPQAGEATKVYLTLDEVKALASTECKYPQLKKAFLFACFCGLRYSDIKNLVWGQLHQISDEAYQVEIKQQKTGNLCIFHFLTMLYNGFRKKDQSIMRTKYSLCRTFPR